MTKLNSIPLVLLAFSSSMIMSTAQAKPVSSPTPDPVWIHLPHPATAGFTVGTSTVTYGPRIAESVFVYDGQNPAGAQDPVSIQSLISTKFGLPSTGAGSLRAASAIGDLTSSTSGSFKITSAFDYLAIHYGRGELLFHWTQPIAADTTFTIAGLPRGLSNYRAYLSVAASIPPVSPVPEPQTYGMMLIGLGMLGYIARRRKSVG